MFRIAVTTDSRTFLLLDSAQALAHSKILVREGGGEGEEMRRRGGGGQGGGRDRKMNRTDSPIHHTTSSISRATSTLVTIRNQSHC